jgi:hypothetical protein
VNGRRAQVLQLALALSFAPLTRLQATVALGGIPGGKVTVEGEAVLKIRAQDRRTR